MLSFADRVQVRALWSKLLSVAVDE